MWKMLKNAFGLFLILTLVTGVAYPLVVTGIAHIAMPARAGGSVVRRDGKAVGSSLLGQQFNDAGHFWGRPSATSPQPYNGASSTGSNLSPTNPALLDAINARVQALRAADPGNAAPVPVDLVTASGSGLDPHISPAAALYQVPRVARARNLDESKLRALVNAHTDGRTFGLLGEPRVNVLELNLAVEATHR
ncbi:MAG TPA: potassium-transporting ATPase subunit KdpC [Steroidobacteraceae bacterium]|nr:potassium-transporting ATPase subunit KdpC [Steroidobacteraceae bacterium]